VAISSRTIDSGPSPWKVSATAGRARDPWVMSGPAAGLALTAGLTLAAGVEPDVGAVAPLPDGAEVPGGPSAFADAPLQPASDAPTAAEPATPRRVRREGRAEERTRPR
jgi:hypothetical protein